MRNLGIKLQTLVASIISVGSLVAVIIDVCQDIMPEEFSLGLTFVGALSSFYAILTMLIEKAVNALLYVERKGFIIDLLSSYGINIQSYKSKTILKTYQANQLAADCLYVVSQCIHKSNSTRLVDGYNGVETQYYIYTLSASHVEKLLNIMSKYLSEMITDITNYYQKDNNLHIPIIVVPHGRNVLLCENVANKIGIPILISQDNSRDRFTPVNSSEDPYEHLYQTFTGVEVLEECIKNTLIYADSGIKKIVFHGIVADCNITRGSQAISVATNYNNHIASNSLLLSKLIFENLGNVDLFNDSKEIQIEFDKIHDIATLFLADSKSITIVNNNAKQHDLTVNYFFELDEEVKSMIYDERKNIMPFLESTPDNLEKMKRVINRCGFSKATQSDNSSIHDLIRKLQ